MRVSGSRQLRVAVLVNLNVQKTAPLVGLLTR